jgi:hypothetical protein
MVVDTQKVLWWIVSVTSLELEVINDLSDYVLMKDILEAF